MENESEKKGLRIFKNFGWLVLAVVLAVFTFVAMNYPSV